MDNVIDLKVAKTVKVLKAQLPPRHPELIFADVIDAAAEACQQIESIRATPADFSLPGTPQQTVFVVSYELAYAAASVPTASGERFHCWPDLGPPTKPAWGITIRQSEK